jgi:hypothetical protein
MVQSRIAKSPEQSSALARKIEAMNTKQVPGYFDSETFTEAHDLLPVAVVAAPSLFVKLARQYSRPALGVKEPPYILAEALRLSPRTA